MLVFMSSSEFIETHVFLAAVKRTLSFCNHFTLRFFNILLKIHQNFGTCCLVGMQVQDASIYDHRYPKNREKLRIICHKGNICGCLLFYLSINLPSKRFLIQVLQTLNFVLEITYEELKPTSILRRCCSKAGFDDLLLRIYFLSLILDSDMYGPLNY